MWNWKRLLGYPSLGGDDCRGRDSDDDVDLQSDATVLLSILLLQDGPPLIIDQPEDDLNMRIINEIVETPWQAKTHRQVIFASHNANLVVKSIGSALVTQCVQGGSVLHDDAGEHVDARTGCA